MSDDKTEKPTPKKRAQARSEGQVSKSMDVNGAVVLAAGLAAISIFGPHFAERMQELLHDMLVLAGRPEAVGAQSLGGLLGKSALAAGVSVAPIAFTCLIAGLVASVGQVGFKPMPKALKPMPKRINPLQGAKNLFGPNLIFESLKSIAKVAVVGGIAAAALFPKLPELAALVGLEPAGLAGELMRSIFEIAWRATAAYVVIAAADVLWQRHRHEKGLKMSKDEVKREAKDQSGSPEMKMAMKRRQAMLSRTRMMGDVPGADVVVTNPTHYAAALKYDGTRTAPVVVAKGKDLIALEIRRVAEENGVPVIEDKPLARSINATVEVGQEIPEDLYAAVAQLLAYVYRVAGRRAA